MLTLTQQDPERPNTEIILHSMFTDRSSVSSYSLRGTEGVAIPMPHTNYLKDSFNYSGRVLLWNSLAV